jgi:hypothetical protein
MSECEGCIARAGCPVSVEIFSFKCASLLQDARNKADALDHSPMRQQQDPRSEAALAAECKSPGQIAFEKWHAEHKSYPGFVKLKWKDVDDHNRGVWEWNATNRLRRALTPGQQQDDIVERQWVDFGKPSVKPPAKIKAPRGVPLAHTTTPRLWWLSTLPMPRHCQTTIT